MSHPKFSIFTAEYNILEMGPFAQTSDRAVQAAAKGRLTRPCPQRDSAAATGVAEPWSSFTSWWIPLTLAEPVTS